MFNALPFEFLQLLLTKQLLVNYLAFIGLAVIEGPDHDFSEG